MAVLSERLKPSQRRAYMDVIDLARRASPHLDRLRIAGVGSDQDEERVAHLIRSSEGILHHDDMLGQAEVS